MLQSKLFPLASIRINLYTLKINFRKVFKNFDYRNRSFEEQGMSAYDNVVVGKLRLKGKALDVKAGGIKKKKKARHDKNLASGEDTALSTNQLEEDAKGTGRSDNGYDDYLTPAERRFLQQTEKLELQRLAKTATKSHRDRIQEFNQYLANLSEHYDIPKVGPG